MSRPISRRGLLRAGSVAGASLLLSGCDGVLEAHSVGSALDFGQWVSLRVQRTAYEAAPMA